MYLIYSINSRNEFSKILKKIYQKIIFNLKNNIFIQYQNLLEYSHLIE